MSDDDDDDKRKNIKEILAKLTPREAMVLKQRFGLDLENDPNLEKVGAQFGVTRERIREIEEKAMEKLSRQRSEHKPSKTTGKSCSFCQKKLVETDKFVESKTGIFICSDCLDMCSKILDEDDPETS